MLSSGRFPQLTLFLMQDEHAGRGVKEVMIVRSSSCQRRRTEVRGAGRSSFLGNVLIRDYNSCRLRH